MTSLSIDVKSVIKTLKIELDTLELTHNPIMIAHIANRIEVLAAKLHLTALGELLFEVRDAKKIEYREDDRIIQYHQQRRS